MANNSSIQLQTIKDFLENDGKTTFKIPPYQRSYSWTKQVNQLINDINDTEPGGEFFIGVIFCHRKNKELIVVDGQQRIVTISLILNKLILKFNEMDSSTQVNEIISKIESCLFNKENNELVVKLKSYRDRIILEKIMDNYDLDLEDQKYSISKAYKIIGESLDKFEASTLFDFAKKILDINLFNIDLANLKIDPNNLFESFNSKNEPLKNYDLIVNSIFMNIEDEKKQEKIHRLKWERKFKNDSNVDLDKFFRDYVSMISCKVVADKAYEIHKGFKLILNSKLEGFKDKTKGVISFIDEIVRYFDIYSSIKTNKRLSEFFADKLVAIVNKKNWDLHLAEYKFLNVDAANSFLMYLSDKLISGEIRISFFDLVLSFVNTYIYKRKVIGITAQERKFFINILIKISALEKNKKQKLPDIICSAISETISENNKLNNNLREVDNAEFTEHIKVAFTDFSRSKYLFTIINNDMSDSMKIDSLDFYRSTTVEHIIPQSFSENDEWKKFLEDNNVKIVKFHVNKLSNLTILSPEQNKEAADKIFETKINIIRTSSFKINNEFNSVKNLGDLEKNWEKFILNQIDKIFNRFKKSIENRENRKIYNK
ncbi:DUF262 domain-containing protein [Spiroplasma alleghenense]|uniref:DUF262 domain-containing protein n=1 Tax=Spiroplasma alleghenense TaxID=216931 RepID=A0A345Z4S9_9MOLU|nr:DUF262 domain-containing protein [Spiroplasma alleghenense]AXK51608.1 hypothetical protein SALLE_v1c09380 [Spiroplasma alleghenense]